MFFPPTPGRLRHANWWQQLTCNTPKTPLRFMSVLRQGAWFTGEAFLGKWHSFAGLKVGPPPLASFLQKLSNDTILCKCSYPMLGTWPKTYFPTQHAKQNEIHRLSMNLSVCTTPKVRGRTATDRPAPGTTSKGKGIPLYIPFVAIKVLTRLKEES